MIYISIGSNIGNRLSNIRHAVKLIEQRILKNTHQSIIIETNAILKDNSPDSWNMPYLNMVIAGETKLSPNQLLSSLKDIEKTIGREDSYEKWSPRVIDLDILLYNNEKISTENLCIPHSELLNRDFFIHLLAMMPESYIPYLNINGSKIKADEYAHKNLDANKLFTNSFALGPEIVGILNITPDSFSDGGKNFNPDDAVKNANQMVKDGAEIIDIGAQSTRPGGIEIIGPDAEYERLKPVLDNIKSINAKISIDSYHPKLILRLIENYEIDWINDVTGNLDNQTLKEVAQAGCKIATMHSLSIPPRKDLVITHELEAKFTLKKWIDDIYEKMSSCGFSDEDIIVDPGIGFGKSIYQNLSLLKNVDYIKKTGIKLLIGHSRKSFMTGFCKEDSHNRDLETAAISSFLKNTNNVDYIRVHNPRHHQRLFVTNQVLS